MNWHHICIRQTEIQLPCLTLQTSTGVRMRAKRGCHKDSDLGLINKVMSTP